MITLYACIQDPKMCKTNPNFFRSINILVNLASTGWIRKGGCLPAERGGPERGRSGSSRVREPSQERQCRQHRLHFLPLAGDADAADATEQGFSSRPMARRGHIRPRVTNESGALLLRPSPGPLRQSEANRSVRRMGSGRSRHPVSEAGLKNRSVAANRHYFVLAMNQATASAEAAGRNPDFRH